MEIYQKTFTIEANEVDSEGNILIDSLQRRIQNISDEHGNLLGFGFDDMTEYGYFWVVSRLMVEIIHLPRLNDELTIETFLTAPSGAGINRYYKIFSRGELWIKGIAKWSVVSKATLKLVKMSQLEFVTCLDYREPALTFSSDSLKRVDFPLTFAVTEKELIVKEEDLDFNNHVNNTIYVEYLRLLYGISSNLKAYQINFIAPLYLGDRVIIKRTTDGTKVYFEAIRRISDQTEEISFQAWFLY